MTAHASSRAAHAEARIAPEALTDLRRAAAIQGRSISEAARP